MTEQLKQHLSNFKKNKQNKNKTVNQVTLPHRNIKDSKQYTPTRKVNQYKNRAQNVLQQSQGSHCSTLNVQQLPGYEKLSKLSQRLKNIHHFYKIRIDQQKSKNIQRNEVFMNIIEQLNLSHAMKIQSIKQEIKQIEFEKHQVQTVDDKMSSIKGSIDQILRQSQAYKQENQKLEQQITMRQEIIRHKEREYEKIKREILQYRKQEEEFQRKQNKQKKRKREILEMIENVVKSIRS